MKTIKKKLSSNHAPLNYFVYCISFIIYGLLQTCLGPIIPYLADWTHNSQTEYSFLFLSRAFGCMFGAYLMRYVTQYLTYHNILMWCSVLLTLLLLPFSFCFDMLFQAFIIFWASATASILQITINLCILRAQKGG